MPTAASLMAAPNGISGDARLRPVDNANPNVNLNCIGKRDITEEEMNEDCRDAFDEREVFDLIR